MSASHDIQTRFLASYSAQDCRPRAADVLCYLGGAAYRPKPNILRRVNKAMNLAAGVVAPAAAFAIIPVRKADRDGVLLPGDRHLRTGDVAGWREAAYIAASVATLGPDLEEKCRELRSSEPFTAIVLDAVGVACLDKLSEMVGRETDRQARMRGLYGGARICPGLQGAELSLQTLLFDLVNAQALGVDLTVDLVMKPFKSISEIRVLTSRPQEFAADHKCRHCDLRDCGFRRTDPDRGHRP